MKKLLSYISTATIIAVIFACNEQPKPEQKAAPAGMEQSSEAQTIKLDPSLLASANDPVCGMSIKDGIGDTTTYKGKIYGFCSASCKEDFLKEPEKYISIK
jgi:YHS domain-containing protein